MNKATLNNLIGFVPENDAEREIFDSWRKDVLNDYLQDSKSTWSNGNFYLGGFITMRPDDEITMKKIDEFIDKYYRKIFFVLLILIFFNTCGNPNKVTNKRLDALTTKIDSLQSITLNKKDLQIEGLKAEKRMIQSTDRKMLDVNRQAEIDKEIEKLSK